MQTGGLDEVRAFPNNGGKRGEEFEEMHRKAIIERHEVFEGQ